MIKRCLGPFLLLSFPKKHTAQNMQIQSNVNMVLPQSFLFGFHHGRLLQIRKFLTLHCGC